MGRGRDAADVPLSTAFGVANLVRFDVVTDEQADSPAGQVTDFSISRKMGPDSARG
jgi:hypothetical protein